MSAPIPGNEAKRLAALRRYQILDTAPERQFDDCALLASVICQTPIATMTLIDENRQWFKARIGLEATETPRELAFCAHTILDENIMVVEDAARDARFAANPLVTAAPHIRFYAGAPLIDADGNALGSLCVIDRRPRPLPEEQRLALQALARQVMAHLQVRDVAADLAAALKDVHILRGLLPVCAWCRKIRDDAGYWQELETYVRTHTEANFTHGICAECAKKWSAE